MSQEGITREKPLHFYQNTQWRLASYGLWIGVVLLLTAITMLGGAGNFSIFTNSRNIQSLSQMWLITAILVPPMILVIATGGVDLSVGATAGFVAVTVAAALETGEVSEWAALFIALRTAIVIGLVNGLLAGLTRLHGAIVTLGMMAILRNAANVVSDGRSIIVDDAEFFSGLAIPAGILSLLLIAAIIVLAEFTPIGRKRSTDFAQNEPWISGTIRIAVPYLISSIMAGFAGLLLLARFHSALPSLGMGLETEAILAVFIAGTPFGGGLVNVIGAMLASFLIALHKNILLIGEGSPFAVQIHQGYALLIFGALSQVYFIAADWIYGRRKSG